MVPKERDRSLQDETGAGAFMSPSLADSFRLHVNYSTVLDVSYDVPQCGAHVTYFVKRSILIPKRFDLQVLYYRL